MILLKLLNSYRSKNCLNPAQLEGTITCIPKGGKVRHYLKNWRPITLLNSIYKFFSSIIAYRIKNYLPKLIHYDQKGFINGRFIGENSRLMYDIINACNNQNSNYLIILIDFEKAFDSISWDFITKTLKIFNFGDNTIQWIKSLQKGSTSKILQNGHFSKNIILKRGCRQGDPISPYLFVLAAEILAEAIRSKEEIEGITIHKQQHKTSLYADDTTLFLKGNEQSIRGCMQILKEFEQISGLKVNKEKTKVAKLGVWRDSGTILCNDLHLDWTQKFTSLGINYDVNNLDEITDSNIEAKIGEIQRLITLWNARNLTPYGKIIVIKSLLISKITHVLLSLPSPSVELFSRLETTFKNFIWKNGIPKFRREILETLPSLGGLKMTNLKIFDASLKISWIKRLINQSQGWAEFPIQSGINDILKYGDKFPKKILGTIKNKFWYDMVHSIIKLNTTMKYNNAMQLQNMPLWHNSAINIEYRKKWEEKGIMLINDVLNDEGGILTIEALKSKDLYMHFLDYSRLKLSIIKILEIDGQYKKLPGPFFPRILFEVGLAQKGCGRIYNRLMNFNGSIIKEVKEKWETVLNEEIDYKIIENAFIDMKKNPGSAYQKYFQFKLLHSRTAIRDKLYIMKLIDTNLCPLCETYVETIKHAFIDCIYANTLWYQIEQWLKIKLKKTIKISTTDKIFGRHDSNEIIDKVILSAKLVIFNNRKDCKFHHIRDVKRVLFKQLCIEEYHAMLNLEEDKFMQKWEPVYDELHNMYNV